MEQKVEFTAEEQAYLQEEECSSQAEILPESEMEQTSFSKEGVALQDNEQNNGDNRFAGNAQHVKVQQTLSQAKEELLKIYEAYKALEAQSLKEMPAKADLDFDAKSNKEQSLTKAELAEEEVLEKLQDSIVENQKNYPDFFKATDFLYKRRFNQLKALQNVYPDFAQEEKIEAHIAQELQEIVTNAIKRGTDPAQIIYAFAKEAGYSENLYAEKQQDLEQIIQKQNSSKTLTSMGGKNSADPYSLEAIAQMTDKEFSKWIEHPDNEQLFQNLMAQA